MSDSGPANKARRNMLAAALAAGATAPAMARLISTNSSGPIMAGSLLPQPKQLFQDANWNPLIGGKIYTYAAGTLTPKTTYQDTALTITNPNPTVANARGEVLMYGAGAYRVILKDAAGNTIYDVDNIESSQSIVDSLRQDLGQASGSVIVGFSQAASGAVARSVQDRLRDTVSVKDFGAQGGGNDDTDAIRKAAAFAVATKKKLWFPRDRYKLTGPVTTRSICLIISGDGSDIILASNDAGFLMAGSSNHIRDFNFSQATQDITPLAIKFFNDATTPLSIHNKASNCYGSDVHRGIHVYMALNGSGQACYRAQIRDCEFINKYQQKTWAGSFGVSFDGPNAGDAGGNDSRCVNTTVAGYERNFVVNNSVVTQFANCSGDGGAVCFSYEGGSSGMQIIGGYYEYNTVFIGTVGLIKYDAYFLYPSYANNVTFMTGAGISFMSGGMPLGAPVANLRNGFFSSIQNLGVAEIDGVNGLKVYSNVARMLRLELDTAGDWIFQNSRLLLNPTSGLYTDKVQGYSGGAVALDINAANNVTITTQSVERLRINATGGVVAMGPYNSTTASAPNLVVAPDGTFQRSTSSGKYKTDVETLDITLADAILQLRPVWYRSTCEGDRPNWSWYGLIAEEVAAIEPRLVHWGYSKYLRVETAPAKAARPAVLGADGTEISSAAPAQEAEYRIEPDCDSPLIPEGVQYDRLTVFLIDVVQRQQKAIADLEQRLAILEKR